MGAPFMGGRIASLPAKNTDRQIASFSHIKKKERMREKGYNHHARQPVLVQDHRVISISSA